MKGVAFLHSMHRIGLLVVILCVISIILATASPFATLALKMRPSNTHFSPIIPYFMPPQNISRPAAALQGPANAAGPAALQGPANAASKTSNQTGTGGFLSKGT